MEELVKLENGQSLTTSVQVAAKFGKRHDNVIRDIELLIGSLLKIEDTPKFVKSQYVSRGKEYPMYVMDRDGFTLLVMGFTGEKALKFKVDYINAFNNMDAEIKSLVDAGIDKGLSSVKEVILLVNEKFNDLNRRVVNIEDSKPCNNMPNYTRPKVVPGSYSSISDMRKKCNNIVQTYSKNTGKDPRSVYGEVYYTFSIVNGVKLKEKAKEFDLSPIATVDKLGMLPQLYDVICDVCDVKQTKN